MRSVLMTKKFRHDLKRESKGKYRRIVDQELWEVIDGLANDEVLGFSYHDHALIGKWLGSRECHLAFDFVLIYTLVGYDAIMLERLGSHSEVLDL